MKLQVGDNLYSFVRFSDAVRKRTIDRVTKTQAMSGHDKFRREYNTPDWISIIGSGSGIYHLENPEWIEKYNNYQIKCKYSDLVKKPVSIEKMQQIIGILEAE